MSAEYEAAVEIREQLAVLDNTLQQGWENLLNSHIASMGALCATLDRGLHCRPQIAAAILSAILRQAGVDLVSDIRSNPADAGRLFRNVWKLTDHFLTVGGVAHHGGMGVDSDQFDEEGYRQYEEWLNQQAGREGHVPPPDAQSTRSVDGL